MKTPEQIKGAIRNISKKCGTNPNAIMFFEVGNFDVVKR